MRLWHIDLIPYLPKSQLVAQWRELNSIFKKQDKHILINYIYDYSVGSLFVYSNAVIDEMCKRKYKIRSMANFDKYFEKFLSKNNLLDLKQYHSLFGFDEHNDEYLTICYWNLREKYIRGQKDFTKEVWEKLDKFYKERIKHEIQSWFCKRNCL